MDGYCSEQQAVKEAARRLGYQMVPVNRFFDPKSGYTYTAKQIASRHVWKSGQLYFLQRC